MFFNEFLLLLSKFFFACLDLVFFALDFLSDFFVCFLCSEEFVLLRFYDNFLLSNVLTELNRVSVKLLLLLFLLFSPFISISNHVLHLQDLVRLLHVVVLNANLLLLQRLIPVLNGLKPLFLFLFDFPLLFVLINQVSENLVFFKLAMMLLFPLEIGDLNLDLGDFLALLLLILSGVLNILVALADLLL